MKFLTGIVIALLMSIGLGCASWYDYAYRRPILTEGQRLQLISTAHELLDSAYQGLVRFHHIHGRYPQITGKYFFDSIKTHIGPIAAYVYGCWPPGMHLDSGGRSSLKYFQLDSCFLASCNEGWPISYKPVEGSGFLLYWVGENYTDEGGQGDDILYPVP